MSEATSELQLGYQLEPLPPGRLGRRWRFELWSGASLLAAGWRFRREQAEDALRSRAARVAHARLGVHPLHPGRAPAAGSFVAGAIVRIDCGPLTCVLVPRGLEPPAAAAAA